MHRPPLFRTTGQSLVEFALVVPLLFALMFVLIELGIVFSIYIGLTNSAREAARAGSVYQYTAATTCSLPSPAPPTPPATVVDCERALVMDQAVSDTLNPIINVTSTDQLNPASGQRYTYQPAVPTLNTYRYGDKVTVSLTYRHQLFFNLLNGPTLNLRATSEMRLEPGGF